MKIKLRLMKSLNIGILFTILISLSSYAQEKPIFIPKAALDSTTDLEKFCTLINNKTQAELNRKVIYNIASNGVIAKSLQDYNIAYTQTRYNHMLLKLFSDAFTECESFRSNYHFVFDSKNKENQEIVAEHQAFYPKYMTFIEKEDSPKALFALSNSKLDVIRTFKYSSDKKYIIAFHKYLPVDGPTDPSDYKNTIAKYIFDIVDGKITIIHKKEDEAEIKAALLTNPPAPGPEPMPKN